VHVDVHPRAQPRHHLEQEEIHVAADLGHVAGVDEQHVARLQPVEHRPVDVLHRLAEEGDPVLVAVAQQALEPAGERLDED
jgi:hypothetical protein